MKVLFILVLVLGGCQKYSEYRKTPSGGVLITPVGIKLKDIKVINWKVGRNRKTEISRGIKFHFTLPLIKKDYLERLTQMNIDTWIVKIKRERVSSQQTLDSFALPLVLYPKKVLGKGGIRPMRSGRINIFYASSFVESDESGSLLCPKLGHNKRVDSVKTKREKSLDQYIHISAANESSLSIRTEHVGYDPEKINGGMSLEGTYIIELALYNKKERKLVSNWFRIDEKIVVDGESGVVVQGCF